MNRGESPPPKPIAELRLKRVNREPDMSPNSKSKKSREPAPLDLNAILVMCEKIKSDKKSKIPRESKLQTPPEEAGKKMLRGVKKIRQDVDNSPDFRETSSPSEWDDSPSTPPFIISRRTDEDRSALKTRELPSSPYMPPSRNDAITSLSSNNFFNEE